MIGSLPGSGGGEPPVEELLWRAARGEVVRHHLDPPHLSFITFICCHHLLFAIYANCINTPLLGLITRVTVLAHAH